MKNGSVARGSGDNPRGDPDPAPPCKKVGLIRFHQRLQNDSDITRAVLEGRRRWQRVTMRPASTYKDGEHDEGVEVEGRKEEWWWTEAE